MGVGVVSQVLRLRLILAKEKEKKKERKKINLMLVCACNPRTGKMKTQGSLGLLGQLE